MLVLVSCGGCVYFFFFKQKTAYEMRISDWSSDVCSSDLALGNLVPNVVLNGSGTFPGTASFSIRGMAISNSIPSSTPTVGVFVDGVFAGVGSGDRKSVV